MYSYRNCVLYRSWWYACCAKCHTEDSGIPSWEPPNWQKVCPFPLCPSYRQFAQNISVLIIGKLLDYYQNIKLHRKENP